MSQLLSEIPAGACGQEAVDMLARCFTQNPGRLAVVGSAVCALDSPAGRVRSAPVDAQGAQPGSIDPPGVCVTGVQGGRGVPGDAVQGVPVRDHGDIPLIVIPGGAEDPLSGLRGARSEHVITHPLERLLHRPGATQVR